MIIDLESIITGKEDMIVVKSSIEVPIELLEKSNIHSLEDVAFDGKIKRLGDLSLKLNGNLIGKMILKDDITLEAVDYNFSIDVEEELENYEDELEKIIVNNKLNLMNLLWQLIQVEVPSKVHKDNRNYNLSGNGWKLLSDKEIESNNNVFKDLDKLLEERSQNNGSSI